MNYLNLQHFIKGISEHDEFQHEIKGKRIKKQLNNLIDYHNNKITFQRYQITSYGASFYVQVHCENKLFQFEILIDFQYPFNRPQIFYVSQNSQYGNGRDLLDNILENNNWGPSLLLSSTFDKLQKIAVKQTLQQKYINDNNEQIKAFYHIGELYDRQFLTKYKIQLFTIEEYQWKYMIKHTYKKVFGLTKNVLLKFTQENNKLKLESEILIKDIKSANAAIHLDKFKLEIMTVFAKSKLYFGGDQADIQKILYYMNPIQVIERKLANSHKDIKGSENIQEAIQSYSQLIEYYSLKDGEKTKKYIEAIHELVKRSYQSDLKEEKIVVMQKEQIKT